MAVAVRSIYSAGVALVGASVVAVSPLTPSTPDVHLPTITAPAIELTATVPAFGAIPYQIGVNALGNILAGVPVLLGSTEQCTVCLGPTPAVAAAVPFTGWGLIGLGAGLIASPIALVRALQTTGDLAESLGVALLAVQVPVQNTLNLLASPRTPVGGYALAATLKRITTALEDALIGAYDVTTQALVSGPVTVLAGAIAAGTAFSGALAATGDLMTAMAASRAKWQPAVQSATNDLLGEIEDARIQVYSDLTGGPGVATSPIPTIPLPTLAATSGPTSRVVNSFKAVPNAASSTAADNSAGAGKSDDEHGTDQASAPSTPKKKSGLGGSKRQATATR